MAAALSLLAVRALWPSRLLSCGRALLSSSVCSRGAAEARQPQPEQRLTSCRQLDGIRTIILNNPKKRNALSLHMLKSLRNDILHDAESKDLRVIIISAEGPVFSSGHDLTELSDEQSQNYHAEVFRTCAEVMMLIQKHPVPIIAKVNGLATAAGCQLVASCDIALASEKSHFATPGVNVGLFCSTPAVALGRAVPRKEGRRGNTGESLQRRWKSKKMSTLTICIPLLHKFIGHSFPTHTFPLPPVEREYLGW
ncbi:enoyl-CoA hydratase domain-containing protein 3, mitochondrial isoform X2 [Monodelphis domestica]|uniref:enoyl-CoA hydratase domain-containing protein 3, mitochondrial isoform X2 n=1 Tax=Monodelphis domestica TaxID=13616 RepID=UPI0004433FDE|nr:enoyl-CoA hydratase domain-containing protein 3, mitochondrial isoform X2 [Monodelphis domestica]